jgi:hypothetical protein
MATVVNDIKMVSGIDALYFFMESNENYEELFLELLDQRQDCIDRFTRNEVDYQSEDITVDINGCTLFALGMNTGGGFYWFRDANRFFKIGFKDRNKNKGLHNIQVQLYAQGIYTVGIKSVVAFINTMLDGYVTDVKPVTRADLNAFVSVDFSFLTKQIFVTRKKQFREFNAIGDKNSINTIYIGKKPALLRLYNKKLELFSKKEKIELMDEYLSGYGVDIHGIEPLWNIEFELHRSYMKSFGISTVEELLSNADNLFKKCMEDVRLIDPNTLTRDMIDSGHSNRAETLPIWNTIKEAYRIDGFLQSPITLERLKRKEYKYTEQKAIEEHIALGRKAKLNGIVIGIPFYEEVIRKIEERFSAKYRLKEELEKLKERFNDIKVYDMESGETYTARIDKETNSIHKLNPVVSFAKMGDYELFKEYETLVSKLLKHPINSIEEKTALYKVQISRAELIKRGLIEDEPMPF